MVNAPSDTPSAPQDHRSRLYTRYVTLQVQRDLAGVRELMNRPQSYLESFIRHHVPKERSVEILDVGCGFGSLLRVFHKMGYANATGIEISAEQVATAHSLGIDCVRQGDLADELQRSQNAYDVIVAFDVLEHFTKDEVLEVLSRAYQALKPGGRLILHVPNGEAIFAGKIYFGDFTHQVAFTSRSLRQVATYAGFSEVNCYEDKPIIHGLFSAVRALLWGFIRTGYRVINMIETGDTGRSLILSQNLLAVCIKG